MNHRELINALTPLHGAGEARAIVRMVMEERFGLSQTDLLLGKDTDLSANDRAELEKIMQRLLAGEPVQHILGYADFCGHRFHVTPDVLIPRPETEELVRWAIDAIPRSSSHGYLLDLCTGSGCIAICLALAYPDAHVIGVDVSEPALSVARNNAQSLNATNVEFINIDLLSQNTSTFNSLLGPKTIAPSFSLLTANPPYVRASEAADIHPTVLDHEPALALFVPDEDPLRFYRVIARIGHQCLLPGASLIVEINAALATETHQLFADFGYGHIIIRNDQFDRPRILKATK